MELPIIEQSDVLTALQSHPDGCRTIDVHRQLGNHYYVLNPRTQRSNEGYRVVLDHLRKLVELGLATREGYNRPTWRPVGGRKMANKPVVNRSVGTLWCGRSACPSEDIDCDECEL